jgi:hypothetical protein
VGRRELRNPVPYEAASEQGSPLHDEGLGGRDQHENERRDDPLRVHVGYKLARDLSF